MACPREVREEIEKFGPYGDSGQSQVDEVEALIIRRRNTPDLLRGIRGLRGRDGEQIISLVNETKWNEE
jgi:hypothetical protein